MTMTLTLTKSESFRAGLEDAAFFDLELDDGCTWSPTRMDLPSTHISPFEFEQDELFIRTITTPSSFQEEKLIRKLMRLVRKPVELEDICQVMKAQGYTCVMCTGRRSARDMLHNPKHEFIKVSIDEETTLIVDAGFQAFMEVARPSLYYKKLVEGLPKVFIGNRESLRCLVSFMAEQLSRSFGVCGMPCPPWREKQCLLN